MRRWLLWITLMSLLNCHQLLHLTVMEPCLNCVRIWRHSGLFFPEHFRRVKQAHEAWQPQQPQFITSGVRLEILQQKDAPATKIVAADGYTAIVERQYMSMQSSSWSEALGKLAQYSKHEIMSSACIVLARPGWMPANPDSDLPNNIIAVSTQELERTPSDVVQHAIKECLSKTQEEEAAEEGLSQEIFHSVMQMCEGTERWTLMNELELILAAPVASRSALLAELRQNVGAPCQTVHNHLLFALGSAAILGWVAWDFYQSYKMHLKPYSPI